MTTFDHTLLPGVEVGDTLEWTERDGSTRTGMVIRRFPKELRVDDDGRERHFDRQVINASAAHKKAE